MARLSKKIAGTISNVIFYEFRGKQVIRSKPLRVKQTKASKAAAKDFGRAVRYSRIIRNSLDRVIDPKDKPMMYRLNNELLQWLRDSKDDSKTMAANILRLESFDFNGESYLGRCLRFKPLADFSVKGKIFVDIRALKPSPDIIAPRDTKNIEWNIMAIRCNTGNRPSRSTDPITEYMMEFNMDYNSTLIPAQRLELPFQTLTGDIVFVVIGLKYFVMKQKKLVPVEEKKWLPVGLVGAWYRE
jgi:hypothetical protein